MLVLRRQQSEQIRIGDSIVVTVCRIAGGSVKIGIDAPSDQKIVRGELAPEREGQPNENR